VVQKLPDRIPENIIKRYDRQLPLIGMEGQARLASSSVLVAGLGGLGSPVAYYLAAAGVGRLILLDKGLVKESNLQRQILYTVSDIGRPKAHVAAERLKRLNPLVEVEPVQAEVSGNLLDSLLPKVDVIVDGLDNWRARMIIDDAIHRYGKPFIHAGIKGFYGQLTVIIPGRTPCLRRLFPGAREDEKPIPVFPPTAGVIGSLEANETLKILLGWNEKTLANKILIYDGLRDTIDIVKVNMKPGC
jgi:molybdopterin/thiamine biosynthesis adenylyltransferase